MTKPKKFHLPDRAASDDANPIPLDVRADVRELLEQAERAIPRLRASLDRDQAGYHAQVARDYLPGGHLGLACGAIAWSLAHCDAAAGADLSTALGARWQQVASVLPERMRKAMAVRPRNCA